MVDPAPEAGGDAARLNGQCQDVSRMEVALQGAMRAKGNEWQLLVQERCPHLFASAPVFISASQLQQMRAVIAAVERVVRLPGWQGVIPAQAGIQTEEKNTSQREDKIKAFRIQALDSGLRRNDGRGGEVDSVLGVFYGYDFHLNAEGAHLIEVNTNAGGAFLNALLIDSQRAADLPGTAVATADMEQCFLAMFRNEWQLAQGDAPLACIAIVDERPEAQYLYPEFLLAQRLFERTGIVALIADPNDLQVRDGGVYCNGQRVDLIYNRLTDFDLQQFSHLRSAWMRQQVVLTPDPAHYARYADKRNLVQWSDAAWLHAAGVSQSTIDVLLHGIPQTRLVRAEESERWWAERKAWFFKPVTGYGSKGAYRGDKVTKRVFAEIMQGGYVAQRLQPPGERIVCPPGGEPQSLKYDVRCYVYDGELQLAAARLYQGQTTNFRTPGGGFASVRLLA